MQIAVLNVTYLKSLGIARIVYIWRTYSAESAACHCSLDHFWVCAFGAEGIRYSTAIFTEPRWVFADPADQASEMLTI